MNQTGRGGNWAGIKLHHERCTYRRELAQNSNCGFRIAKRKNKEQVIRGSGWLFEASYCPSAYRGNDGPAYRYYVEGFRVSRRKL